MRGAIILGRSNFWVMAIAFGSGGGTIIFGMSNFWGIAIAFWSGGGAIAFNTPIL